VAAWLETQTGAANDPAWQWTVKFADSAAQPQPVTLAALGLKPCDTACLSTGTLHSLAISAVAQATEVLPDCPGDQSHARVRQLIALLGSRPAIPADLALGIAWDDSGVAPGLRVRYETLYNTCGDLISQFNMAADEANKRTCLLNALRWGIVPLPEDNPTIDDQVNAARSALSDRRSNAPVPTATANMSAEAIAKAIAELATPDGRYAVLGRIDFTALQGLTVPATTFMLEARPNLNALNPLDTVWLQAIATVRPNMARLESHQLEYLLDGQAPPLFAWTNRPGDPWQLNVVRDPDTHLALATRLMVLYGPEGVLNGLPTCAVGLVDAWSETIPETDHATSAAFGFNAPASRARRCRLTRTLPWTTPP
jgi:hypothetical protein